MVDIRIEIPSSAQPTAGNAIAALWRRLKSVFATAHWGQLESVARPANHAGTNVETRFLATRNEHLKTLARYRTHRERGGYHARLSALAWPVEG